MGRSHSCAAVMAVAALGLLLLPVQASAQAVAVTPNALVARGVELARDGHLRDAIRTFEQALEFDPQNRDARYNLALACHNAGEHRRAAQEFHKVLKTDPRALDARKGLGLAQVALRQYSEAVASLQQVLDTVPNDAVALAGLGRAYMGAGNPSKALPPLRRAVALRPQDPGLAFELGKAEAALGHHGEAKQAFLRALNLKPESAGAAVGLAKSQIATDQALLAVQTLSPFARRSPPDRQVLETLAAAYDALKLTEEALRTRALLAPSLPPKQAVALRVSIGNALLEKLNWRQAREQFEAAAQADPKSPDAHIGLARCYRGLRDQEKELTHWLAASGLGPDRIEAWRGLAEALSARGDLRGALAALDKGLKADPVDLRALSLAADTARALGDLKLVEAYLRRILALDPSDFKARMAVVDALAEQGRLGQTIIEAGEALRAPNPPPEAYMKVAFLAEQAKNYLLAITQWRRLMERGGEHEVPAALELGRLLLLTHEVPAAIKLYREQLKKRPNSPELTLGLARAHQSIGQDDEAVALLRPLLEANPDLTEGRVALAESLAWLDRHKEAREQIGKVVARGPLSEKACRTLVLVCERSGRLPDAIATLERLAPTDAPEEVGVELLMRLYRHEHREAEGGKRLLELFDRNPSHPRLGLAASRLLGEAKEVAKAEQVLRAIARRRSVRREALQQLVEMHATIGLARRALAPLRELLEVYPLAANIIAMLAELDSRPDLAQAAAEILVDLAEADIGSPSFWLAAAKLVHFLGRVETELARMVALAAQHPGDPGIATGAAVLAMFDGRPEIAERMILTVPDERRSDRVLLHTLAQAQVALGKPEEAMATLRRAIEGDRGAPDDHILYAQLLRQARRFADGLWHLVVALRLHPLNEAAREGVRQVIQRDELPPTTVMEGIKYVYHFHPDTPVVFELVDALSDRPDAQQMCYEWLSRHPKPETEPEGG